MQLSLTCQLVFRFPVAVLFSLICLKVSTCGWTDVFLSSVLSDTSLFFPLGNLVASVCLTRFSSVEIFHILDLCHGLSFETVSFSHCVPKRLSIAHTSLTLNSSIWVTHWSAWSIDLYSSLPPIK